MSIPEDLHTALRAAADKKGTTLVGLLRLMVAELEAENTPKGTK
jgi:hypothetical protein